MDQLNPDLDQARRFLALFGEGDAHFFQVFHDSVKGGEAWNRYGTLDEMAGSLVAANRRGLGVYFTVNETDTHGRSKGNITRVRAIFLDLDGAPLENVLGSGVEPHAIVESSPGKYQVYWLVNGCPLERFDLILTALARRFGGDESVAERARVMRVPGFYHRKKEPYLSRLIELNVFLPYDIDVLVDAFDIQELEETAKTEKTAPLPPLKELLERKLLPGQRHKTLMQYAGLFARQAYDPAEIFLLLKGINSTVCSEPKSEKELWGIVDYVARKEPPIDLSKLYPRVEVSPEEGDPVMPRPMLALPLSLLTTVPGMVGEIAAWLTETNYYPQLSYSLAASLAFVGALKGHFAQTEDNCRSNLYTVVVGYSSSGKTVPINRLTMLAERAGVQEWVLGEPSTGPGLRAALQVAGGKGMVLWDEMGMAIQDMLSSKSNGYRKEIIRSLMKFYSESGHVSRASVTAGAHTRDHRGNQAHDPSKLDIDQPCLCVYGTSTPGDFFGALSSKEAVNGFVSRLLVFETHDYLLERQELRNIVPPESMVRRLAGVAQRAARGDGSGNLVGHTVVSPRVIPYSEEATRIFSSALSHFEDERRRAVIDGDEVAISLWGRALEHAKKVALVCEDGYRISGPSAKWAVELVSTMVGGLLYTVRERIVENQHHADTNRLLGIIQSGGHRGVTMKDLNLKTRGMDDRKRGEKLRALQEEGTIVIVQARITPGQKRPTTFYFMADQYTPPQSAA